MQERPLAAYVKGRLLVLEVHQGWDVPQHHLSPDVLHEVLKYSSGMDFLLFREGWDTSNDNSCVVSSAWGAFWWCLLRLRAVVVRLTPLGQ